MKIGLPVHAVLEGKTLKLIVPVGLKPFESVAESEPDWAEVVRIIVEGETEVMMTGPADWTVSTSPLSPHAPVTGLLLESPV